MAFVSNPLLLRVGFHVCTLLICCEAYRPDDADAKQLSLEAKGTMMNGTGKMQRLEPSSFEESWANESLANGSSSDRAFRELLEEEEEDEREHGEAHAPKMKCSGTGTDWVCKNIPNRPEIGRRVAVGGMCVVDCLDKKNRQVKTASMGTTGVACNEGGIFAQEPECIQKVQCQTKGGGWQCTNTGKRAGISDGEKCDVVCNQKDYIATSPLQCKVKGEQPTWQDSKGAAVTGEACREGKKCNSKNETWSCGGGQNGREDIKHGEGCDMKCTDDKMYPQFDKYTCQDGAWDPEPPKCGPDKPKPAPKPKGAPGSKGLASSLTLHMSLPLLIPIVLLASSSE